MFLTPKPVLLTTSLAAVISLMKDHVVHTRQLLAHSPAIVHCVLDAGSGGTRPFVFVHQEGKPIIELKGNKLKQHGGVHNCQTSSVTVDSYFQPVWNEVQRLLKTDNVQSFVTSNNVFLDFKATAGMRDNLTPTESHDLLHKVEGVLDRKCTFQRLTARLSPSRDTSLFPRFHKAVTIDGEVEALGTFINANPLTWNDGIPNDIGIIEMGGSSLQIKSGERCGISLSNYGTDAGLRTLAEFLGLRDIDSTKPEDFTYQQVKECFFGNNLEDLKERFCRLGGLKAEKAEQFVRNLVVNHEYALVGAFEYRTKDFMKYFRDRSDTRYWHGIGESQRLKYFPAVTTLVSEGIFESERFNKEVPVVRKFQMCLHAALFETLQQFIDSDKTSLGNLNWALGLSIQFAQQELKRSQGRLIQA